MRQVQKGSTDVSVVIRIVDETDGTPETGVEHNTTGIDLWYRREGAAKVSITEAALASLTTAHTDGGIEHIGDGYYRLDIADAAFATGASSVMIGGAVTGMIVMGTEVQLVDFDPEDSVRLGLTAMPNAAAGAAGGLPNDTDANGRVRIVVGTGAGELNAASKITSGTAQGGTSNSITLAAGESATNDFHNAQRILLIAGTGAGQSSLISDYNGTTKVADIPNTWRVTPDNTTVYEIQAAESDVRAAKGVEMPTGGVSGHVVSDMRRIVGQTMTTAVANNFKADYGGAGYAGGTIPRDVNTTQIEGTDATDALDARIDARLAAIGLDHLLSAAVTGTDVANNSALAKLVSASATADWDDFDNTTDSLQAIRDRGDSAWTTGGGGSITDIINVQPLIPNDIDLANTATVRLGLMLFNALDDLPSTAEITPGTISIERKAIGGTSWSAVVTDAACSESAGQIYYDEVFDSGSGYAEGDSIRVTFKSQKITVSSNDYEITDATGRMMYTSVRQTMRGTDSANTTTPLDAAGIRAALGLASANLDTQLSAIDTVVDAILLDTGTDGVVLSTAMLNKIADHVISRNLANVESSSDGDTESFRSLQGAISKLVNRIAVSGSTLTVNKTDDSTALGTQAVTSNANADPITALDTA